MSIQKLPSGTIKLIGSTQVITSVSSAVKELFENSIDAGATTVDIRLDNYGLDKIEVKDDGRGIPKSDVQFACLKSYTSKISTFDDIEKLTSYGFRGEALNALCTLGQVSVTTIAADEDIGFSYIMNCDGSIKHSKPSHISKGTVITVEGLLRRVPVRRQRAAAGGKKTEELRRTEAVIKSLAAVHPNLRVTIAHDKCTLWVKSRCRTLLESIAQVVPPTVARQLHSINFQDEKDRFNIILPKKDCNVPTMCCSNMNEATHIYINLRPITDRNFEKEVQSELYQYFGHFIPSGKYPYIFVLVHLPPDAVDINLEPNKTKAILTDADHLLIKLKKVICDYYCSGKLVEENNVEDSSTLKRKKDDFASELEPCEKVLKIENNELTTITSANKNEECEKDEVLDVANMLRELTSDINISFDAVVTSTQVEDSKFPDEGFESDSVIEKKTDNCQRDQNISDFFDDLLDSGSQENTLQMNDSAKMLINAQELVDGDISESLEDRMNCEPIRITTEDSFDEDEIRVMSAEMNEIINENRHLIDNNVQQNGVDEITLSQWSRGQVPGGILGSNEQAVTVSSGARLVAGSNLESVLPSQRKELSELSSSNQESLLGHNVANIEPNSNREHIRSASHETADSSLSNIIEPVQQSPESLNADNKNVECVIVSDKKMELPRLNEEISEVPSISNLLSTSLGSRTEAETSLSKPKSIESQMGMKHMAGFKTFAKEAKREMLQSSPGMSFVRVASKLVSDWKQLGADEKKHYEELAKAGKANPTKSNTSIVAKSDPGRPIIIKKNCYEKICYLDVSLDSIKANSSEWGSRRMNDDTIFGHLSDDVHLFFDISDENKGSVEINSFSAKRLAEVLLLYRNLSSLEVSSRVLAEPVSFKKSNLDKHAWEYLVSLKQETDPRDGSTVVADEALTKNGFRIERSQECGEELQFYLTNVAAQINHIGLDDLQELLLALRQSQDVARSRPLKIVSFIRSESVRSLDRSTIQPIDTSNIESSLNFYRKNVRAVLPKCPHHRLVVKLLYSFNMS